MILRQYHKHTTQETTSWYYLSIHFRPATESRCLCRKKAWRKSQAPCWSQDRAPGKHHEISWLNYHDRPSWDVTRLHESAPQLEESMSQYVPIFFDNSQYVHHMSLWWSLMCFGDLMVSPSSPEFRVIPVRPALARWKYSECLSYADFTSLVIYIKLYKYRMNIEWLKWLKDI